MSRFHTQRVSFLGSLGHRLTGRLECPEDEPLAYAVFAHCFTCSKDYIAATRVSRALARRGVAALRFDFTGLGDSEGDFSATSFSTNITDIECAAAFLHASYSAPEILIGHSLGGAAVIAAATRIPQARVIATIAAPSDPSHVIHHFENRVEDIEREHESEVDIAGRLFRISKQFLDDIGQFDMKAAIADLGKTLLVFHSPEDDVVGITHAERIFALAAYPKSFLVLDGADHLLTRAADAEFVADTIAAWAARFIHPRARHESPAEFDTSGAVIVSETSTGRYAQRIRVGRHTLNADEPRALGGDDRGPSPYDLLLASLGSCTAMTIRMSPSASSSRSSTSKCAFVILKLTRKTAPIARPAKAVSIKSSV